MPNPPAAQVRAIQELQAASPPPPVLTPAVDLPAVNGSVHKKEEKDEDEEEMEEEEEWEKEKTEKEKPEGRINWLQFRVIILK